MDNDRRDLYSLMAEVTGAAAVGVIQWLCPLGCTARVIWAEGDHNEGAALDLTFAYLNIASGLEPNLHTPVSMASAAMLHLYEQTRLPECLILHQGDALEIYGAVTGAHVLHMAALLELRRGEAV